MNDLLHERPRTQAEMDLLFKLRLLLTLADKAIRPDVAAKIKEAVALMEAK